MSICKGDAIVKEVDWLVAKGQEGWFRAKRIDLERKESVGWSLKPRCGYYIAEKVGRPRSQASGASSVSESATRQGS